MLGYMMDRDVLKHLKTRPDNSVWECEFCGHPFPFSVTIKTFRSHLTGVQGSTSRIRICESVPEDVKEAAAAVLVEQTRPRRTRGGVSTNEVAVQRTEVDAGCSRVEGNWEPTRIPDACEDNNSNFEAQAGKEIEAEVSSVQRTLEGRGGELMDQRDSTVQSNKRQRTMPDALPIVAEVEVPMVDDNQQTRESSSLTKRLVGDAFQRNEKEIRSWLMDDQVLQVGIYGMGGVGKTTLMRHIQTLLEGQSSFEVYWITVSHDSSIWKLQNLIAKKIGFNFSDNEDQVDRAGKLTKKLRKKGKCVLILDDLWNYFDIDAVGIPVEVNACKLVLTTRLLDVCRQMGCSEGNTIQLQRLPENEAWVLFTQELGNYVPEVEELAKSLSGECAGLPLGIKVMARTMRGIRNVHTWRNALTGLKESKLSEGHEMQEEVFSVLKFSYLYLIDPALQKCLLYCALFPEDHKIGRGELIEYMIVEGIIDAKKSRRAELDRGHTMLDTLVNACLLEGDTTDVWMHDLIRDMAIYELRERSNTLVEAGAQLKELPDLEEWTENLVCVSLMYNDIKVIPSSHTPRCPNLSTLFLRHNYGLRKLAGSFLKQFQKLKVLDLSWCVQIEELPVDVSDLVNLTALLLQGCKKLSHVPSLAKLERLEKLDLGKTKVSVRGKEVGRLAKLESLECNFDDTKEWRKYFKSREKSQQSLTHYFFVIGEVIYCWRAGLEFFVHDDWRSSNGVYLWGGGSSSNDYVALPLPTDIQTLIIEDDLNGSLWDSVLALKHTVQLHFLHLGNCDGIARWDNLCGLSEVELLSNLKSIQIEQCHKLKNLPPAHLLPNLQKIRVWHCRGMELLFGTEQEGEQVGLNLPQLVLLELWGLPELRSIYNGATTCHSLYDIRFVDCPKLERITIPLPQPLQILQVWPREWWESVQWGSANDKIHLKSVAVYEISDYSSDLLHSVKRRCPNLSTLLLRINGGLRNISVLEQFQKLKVLNLSQCHGIEELPAFVSDLVNLIALLLRGCRDLSHVPSLAKLERLKKLDLSGCRMLKRMPEGVELLINLEHLDLSLSGIERIGSELIPKLSRLQVLNLGKTGVSVKGKEVGRLAKLESLECNFDDTKEWRKYFKSREKSQQSLTHYFFVIGEVIYCWRAGLEFFVHDDWRSSNGVYLWGGGSRSNDYVALPLPTDIQTLIIEDDLNGSLWDSVLALKHTVQLHFLHLGNCDGIARWDNLCGLSEVELLSNLKSIQIEQCHKLKNLPPAHLLPNLQKIRVWHCRGMEEVFGTDQEGEQVGLNLPQLVLLELWGLPELRSIYNGAITCHSLYDIRFIDCPKLERITIPLPQPLQILQVSPKEWWESVQWGSANDKIYLESLVGFWMRGYGSHLLHSVKRRQTV